MRLDPPLSSLFDRCMTLCEAACCGIDAYDVHPVHVASFLLMSRAEPVVSQADALRHQLATLKANYGSVGASARGVTLDDLNQAFSGQELDTLVARVGAALDQALVILSETRPGAAAKKRV